MNSNEVVNDESSLVRELSKGNILAFNSLFGKYSRRLYGFAYGYLKSDPDSEELVQEVFTIVWAKRAELRHELSFKSFLFTISFNIIRKHFRTKAHLSDYLQSGLVEESDMQTSNLVSYNSLYQYIVSLINKLPEKRRMIFIKSRLEGLSIKEISEELQLSHKTVENQITEALSFIRKNLKKENISLILFLMLFLQ
ncbi:MAG TPA: RNA polymerase sigma-70 factor [Bacteroidales bacterium]|jgi:RNA polymerase sigma-70 factor (ECF subfamily)|nr:RNA polymerase sigma-70 factor [Bacteroidales bacterium]